jgi:hypothetical protein
MRLVAAVAGVLVLVLLAGLALTLARDRGDRRVLSFPALAAAGAGGPLLFREETRRLPERAALAGELRLLVEEVILGPADHRAHRLLPRHTEVIAVHVKGDTAFVNLSRHVLFDPTPVPTTGHERLQVLRGTILANFRELSTVALLVEGQEPRPA